MNDTPIEINATAVMTSTNVDESNVASHKFTLQLASIMDEVRGIIGMVYPFE